MNTPQFQALLQIERPVRGDNEQKAAGHSALAIRQCLAAATCNCHSVKTYGNLLSLSILW